jgi:hypothetical protein
MLHTETVEPGTFSVLKQLMRLPSLQSFSLVGGTALALRYGHRSSIDLDLFCHEKFDHAKIISELETAFNEKFDYMPDQTQIGIFCFLENVKVDFVYYPHHLIREIEVIDEIRFYSTLDISAMKIQAILGRGKKKDFWDLSELLKHYSLQKIMDWHKQKFPGQMLAISIPHAITYFADADETEEPVSLKNQTWTGVKRDIQQIVREYLS